MKEKMNHQENISSKWCCACREGSQKILCEMRLFAKATKKATKITGVWKPEVNYK